MCLYVKLRRAWRVYTPIIAIETPDQNVLSRALIGEIPGRIKAEDLDTTPEEAEILTTPAMFQWDLLRGIQPLNRHGELNKEQLAGGQTPMGPPRPPAQGDIAKAIELFGRVSPDSGAVLLCHNAHRWLDTPPVIQSLLNIRDTAKSMGQMVILMGPAIQLPVELQQDVVVFSEELPNEAQLRAIAEDVQRSAGITGEISEANVAAVLGLSAFGAEQTLAMSLSKEHGFNTAALWERKRKTISQTSGLSVEDTRDTLDDIGGLSAAKEFFSRAFAGQYAPRCIVWIDEIEKAMAGSSSGHGDTSGTSQNVLSSLLTYTQEHDTPGAILLGPPGTGKSALPKALGGEFGVPVIRFDLGATKGSLVGQSEAQMRRALDVITAVSGGRALFLATCNGIDSLPPELRRRFKMGTWFFDLPNEEELATIWDIHRRKRGIDPGEKLPRHDNWTGSDVADCCFLSWQLGCSLAEASNYVVPVFKSGGDMIDRLRNQAKSRFLAASYPGAYEGPITPGIKPYNGKVSRGAISLKED